MAASNGWDQHIARSLDHLTLGLHTPAQRSAFAGLRGPVDFDADLLRGLRSDQGLDTIGLPLAAWRLETSL